MAGRKAKKGTLEEHERPSISLRLKPGAKLSVWRTVEDPGVPELYWLRLPNSAPGQPDVQIHDDGMLTHFVLLRDTLSKLIEDAIRWQESDK